MDEESEHYDMALILFLPVTVIGVILIIGLTFIFGGP